VAHAVDPLIERGQAGVIQQQRIDRFLCCPVLNAGVLRIRAQNELNAEVAGAARLVVAWTQ